MATALPAEAAQVAQATRVLTWHVGGVVQGGVLAAWRNCPIYKTCRFIHILERQTQTQLTFKN